MTTAKRVITPTKPERLTEALLDSIRLETMIKQTERDIARVQATRKKIQDLIKKHS